MRLALRLADKGKSPLVINAENGWKFQTPMSCREHAFVKSK